MQSATSSSSPSTPRVLKTIGVLLLGVAGSTGLLACPDPPSDAEICMACAGLFGYICNNGDLICVADDLQAANQCGGGWRSRTDCVNAPLQGGGTEGDATWDPDSFVFYRTSTQTYEIDVELIDDIRANGALLFIQDTARLVEQTSGYYKLKTVSTSDLAYHLGLRTNDVIKKVNGLDLVDWDDYVEKIAMLGGGTQFTLTVQRGANTITLKYKIV
jgi:hypothetical protein